MKRTLLGGLVTGVGCLAFVVVIAETRERGGASQGPDATPRIVNAQLDTRPAGPGLERTFAALAASSQSASWIGYAVATVPGEHHMCDGGEPGRWSATFLEGHRTISPAGEVRRSVALEASLSVAVLFRVERTNVQKIRVFSPDCELDAGGLPVHWLTGVSSADSVSLLAGYVRNQADRRADDSPSDNSALLAIALHADASAMRALQRFASPGQPDAVRKHAAFWLGSTRGREGFDTLQRLVRGEASVAFRRDLVFPLSLSREPEAIDLLIELARKDPGVAVRQQALFWLGQKAGQKVAGTLADAASDDPETAIKERAVFALSRLPNGEGVEKLIEVARSNPNVAVRRRALFWLGQSNDSRALDYLAQVLLGR